MVRDSLPPLPELVKGTIVDTKVLIVDEIISKEPETEGLFESDLEFPLILIAKHMPLWLKWLRFWHELIHKVEDDAQITLVPDEENDEVRVYDRLAYSFFIIWLINGWKLPGEK